MGDLVASHRGRLFLNVGFLPQLVRKKKRAP
jgi:hypothetical protein